MPSTWKETDTVSSFEFQVSSISIFEYGSHQILETRNSKPETALPPSHFFRPVEHLHLRRSFIRAAFQSALVGRANERREHRMRLQRLRLEFRMELAADEMRMIRQLHHLDVSPIRSRSGNLQASCRQRLFILAVELITMPVPLADLRLPINSVRQRSRLDLAIPCAQTHGSAEFF